MPTERKNRNRNQKKVQPTTPTPIKPRRNNKNKIYLAIGIIAVAAVVISLFFVLNMNNGSAQSNKVSNNPMISTTAGVPLTSPAGEYSANGTQVLFITSMGNITIQLRDDKPITTANFVNLTEMGIYDNTIFHRVMAGFMIQGGDPTGTGYGSPSIDTIPDEIGNVNTNVNYNGTIAMANTGQPNSASSQFFINVADNQNLYSSFDSSYTVFGQVISGMNVVMAISHVQVDSNNRPLENVTLVKAEVLP
jgi:peptidylprolyl isomerase